jgi:hypothetical protein
MADGQEPDQGYRDNVHPFRADLGRGGLQPPGGPPENMSTRIARLETALDGVKRAQDFTLAAVVAVGTILGAFMIYVVSRVEQVNERSNQIVDRVNDVPGKISTDIRDITKTLSDAITATKQQAPQVILVPAPTPQPTQQRPK